MAQGRMLRKDVCESIDFSSVNDSNAQLLCLLLTAWWDDHGKMIGDPIWIKGNIVRRLEQYTVDEISRCLEILHNKKIVVWWQDEQCSMWLFWPTFTAHQTINPEKRTKDKLPNPPKSPKIPKNPQKTAFTREVKIREVEEEVKVAKTQLSPPNQYFTFLDNFGKTYNQITGLTFNRTGKHFKLIKTLIDTHTEASVVDKVKVLGILCRDKSAWFTKDGYASFTIEVLSDKWNSILIKQTPEQEKADRLANIARKL